MAKLVKNENQLSFFFDDDVAVAEAPPMVFTPVVRAIKVVANFFVLTNQLDAIGGSATKKVELNLAAIRLLKQKSANFTPSEKASLACYTGWGGAAGAFDDSQKPLGKFNAELKSLLSSEAYTDAKASMLNAYYTEPFVIKAMWNILRKMGFNGGKVLDPSAGVGHFTGCMPEDMRADSSITMVEPDEISSKILNGLYDESTVKVFRRGIESAPLRSGQFDLAISNIPFGQYKVNDSRFNAMKLVIHDYFFAKALDLVREGGLVAFITSTGTMDKDSTNLREYIAQRADLVAAIRLPSGAFERLGGTSVATDIIVLRKKPLVADGLTGESFRNTISSCDTRGLTAHYGVSYAPNAYYNSHKHHHLGKAKNTTRYGNTAVEIEFEGNLEQELNSIVSDLEVSGWYKASEKTAESTSVSMTVPEGLVSGYFLNEADQVAYVDPQGNAELQTHINAKAYGRLYGMVKIRDAALELIELDTMNKDSEHARFLLNEKYDRFEKEHGALMLPVNRRLISLDSHAPLLWSLEYYDEESEAHKKAEIFSRSTVSASVLSDTAETIGDAHALSYNKYGRLNLEFMASALSKSPEVVKDELLREQLAFVDPEGEEVVDAQEYLSGNVRSKLATAQDAFARDARFEKNVLMLQAVVPPTIEIEQISIRLGAPWIEPSDIEEFASEHVFEAENFDAVCNVGHSPLLATWSVAPGYSALRDARSTSEWGTSRRNFFDLLETGLNQQQPVVKDEIEVDGKSKMVTNAVETTAAREKLEKIQDAFAIWIKSDATRAKRLELVYNELFNSVVNRKYDGAHLVIPGLNPVIKLRDAQKDSVWRGIVSGNVLYALAVGGGKTLIQIILAQESKRLGLAQKPVLVVPNHMLEAFAAEYMRAFPKAKILAASKLDMEGDKRRTLMMRMATGNWDAVIITHSSFGRIAISKEFVSDFAAKEVRKLEDALLEVKASGGGDLRAIERTKKSVTARLQMLADKAEKDNGVLPFDKLGVDMLIVDEADLFKNLWFFTKKTRVAGLSNTASSRAFDLFLKSRLIFQKLGTSRRGLVFATATPISNTIAEMFIMQTYLQPETLADAKVGQFDAWAANFGREVTSIEVAPDGSGYRMHTRFCRFENVPELMNLFRDVAEIRTKKMLDLPVPKLAGGKHIVVAMPASEDLKVYVETLVERAEAIRKGNVKPNEDNMLCVTGDGRKAALDMRIISPTFKDFLGSKLNACISNVYKHWEDGKDQKLAQLVFSDISTPHVGRFSVYTDMREKLMGMGVPESEIAFAQDYDTDAKKTVLHRKVRSGRIRILIGSTELMGFGTNVQDRLIAEHHLDAPWRPRDVEQRDGRIERQGNLNAEIYIYRYVTEGSFDAYMWQTLETKAAFIEQIYEGDDVRTIEDVSSASLSCAEVKALASGNPLVIEKAGIDNEVAKLCSLKTSWSDSQYKMKRDLAMQESYIASLNLRIQNAQADMDVAETTDKRVKVGGMTSEPCESIAKELMTIIETAKLLSAGSTARMVKVCEVAGMDLFVETQFGAASTFLVSQSGLKYEAKVPYGKDKVIAWLSSEVFEIPLESLNMSTTRLAETKKTVASLLLQIGRPFDYEERLKKAIERKVEIDSSLGLTKDEAGANALETAE